MLTCCHSNHPRHTAHKNTQKKQSGERRVSLPESDNAVIVFHGTEVKKEERETPANSLT